MKNLFQKVLSHESVKVPPIWMMRQAGRYHSHYQNLRKTHTFMDLCLKPDLACEVAMGPVDDFDFDAAILFSDILFPLKALGMPLDYTDQGPQLGFQLDSENILKLKSPQVAVQDMLFQKEALGLTRARLSKDKGLIGFVGGPWTLFVYACEGTHSGDLAKSKISLQLWRQFSQIIFPFLKENIKLQLEGGADVMMIFDTAAGELSPEFFQTNVQPVLQNLIQSFPNKIGYYSKGTGVKHFNQEWSRLPLLGQGYDHRHQLTDYFQSSQRFVQGNFDQELLRLDPSEFPQVFEDYLKPFLERSAEQRCGWVCGLGHGVLPKTPEKNVRQFIEIVRKRFS